MLSISPFKPLFTSREGSFSDALRYNREHRGRSLRRKSWRTRRQGASRAAEHRPLCLCILAIGALFAWWNLYHDDGFLFLSNYLNQVESCLACYGGALGAFASSSEPGRAGDGASVLAHRPRPCPSAHWYVALHRRYGGLARGVIGGQLFIGTAFFSQLFFLMRWLCTRPVPHIAVAIAVAIATYGVLEAAAWAVMALFPSCLCALPCASSFWHCASSAAGEFFGNAPFRPKMAPKPLPLPLPRPIRAPLGAFRPNSSYTVQLTGSFSGMTHAMASGIIPLGHDKLLPCYIGSVVAGGIFCVAFARDDHAAKLWPRVRTTIFPSRC